MKKVLTLILSLVMALSMSLIMVACGTKDVGEEPTTKSLKTAIDSAFQQFNESENLTITLNAEIYQKTGYESTTITDKESKRIINLVFKSKKDSSDTYQMDINGSVTMLVEGITNIQTSSVYIRDGICYLPEYEGNQLYKSKQISTADISTNLLGMLGVADIDTYISQITEMFGDTQLEKDKESYTTTIDLLPKIQVIKNFFKPVFASDEAYEEAYETAEFAETELPELTRSAYDVLTNILAEIINSKTTLTATTESVQSYIDGLLDENTTFGDLLTDIDTLLKNVTNDTEASFEGVISEILGDTTIKDIIESLPEEYNFDEFLNEIDENSKISEILIKFINAFKINKISSIFNDKIVSAKQKIIELDSITFSEFLEKENYKVFDILKYICAATFNDISIDAALTLTNENKLTACSFKSGGTVEYEEKGSKITDTQYYQVGIAIDYSTEVALENIDNLKVIPNSTVNSYNEEFLFQGEPKDITIIIDKPVNINKYYLEVNIAGTVYLIKNEDYTGLDLQTSDLITVTENNGKYTVTIPASMYSSINSPSNDFNIVFNTEVTCKDGIINHGVNLNYYSIFKPI
jgi:hypothetical protein